MEFGLYVLGCLSRLSLANKRIHSFNNAGLVKRHKDRNFRGVGL